MNVSFGSLPAAQRSKFPILLFERLLTAKSGRSKLEHALRFLVDSAKEHMYAEYTLVVRLDGYLGGGDESV